MRDFSTADGAIVEQRTCSTYQFQTNQHWWLIPVSTNVYALTAVHSRKCVDVRNGSLADGATIGQLG